MVRLTYVGISGDWRANHVFPCNADTTQIILSCTGTQWGLDFVPTPPISNACSGSGGPTTASSCNPFAVTFTGMTVTNCCTGTITAAVTVS